MTSVLAGSGALLGAQRPRVELVPEYVSSAGKEAIELAAMAGLVLDDWQQYVLMHALGERRDGRWSAQTVGVLVPRQNGKGAILEARELAGLFLLGEELIIHSAHQYDTSQEAYRRLKGLIENTPELDRRVKRWNNSHGTEGIELRGGRRIRFRTRTKGGGRGFAAPLVILDEAMFMPEATQAALLPVVSAQDNPQVWYTGSAVDQYVHDDGVVLARIRDLGHSGSTEAGLAWFEWSLDAADPMKLAEQEASDPERWAQANPGLGIRISPDHIAHEREVMDPRTFAVERLSVGDWPDLTAGGQSVIDLATWDGLIDPSSRLADPVAFAYDVTPDRSAASIAAGGSRPDGLGHVEVVDHRSGTGWLVARLVELVGKHEALGVCCDASGPAGSLVPALEAAGIAVTTVTGPEHARACGMFFDSVVDRTLRHLGSAEVRSALKGASRRPLGDAWAWSRRGSATDISPLVACTLAHWLASTAPREEDYPLPAFA